MFVFVWNTVYINYNHLIRIFISLTEDETATIEQNVPKLGVIASGDSGKVRFGDLHQSGGRFSDLHQSKSAVEDDASLFVVDENELPRDFSACFCWF